MFRVKWEIVISYVLFVWLGCVSHYGLAYWSFMVICIFGILHLTANPTKPRDVEKNFPFWADLILYLAGAVALGLCQVHYSILMVFLLMGFADCVFRVNNHELSIFRK